MTGGGGGALSGSKNQTKTTDVHVADEARTRGRRTVNRTEPRGVPVRALVAARVSLACACMFRSSKVTEVSNPTPERELLSQPDPNPAPNRIHRQKVKTGPFQNA
eukprot:5240201-Prymnesium_polylepis.1